MNEHDIRFMQHALELARRGIGLASPNPVVGCAIVADGQIVGEGYHRYDARDHAEIVALKAAGDRAQGATAYVTLEPCNFTGRTGPCSEALIKAGVKRVIAATEDPNPKVAGGGFEALRTAGVNVEVGVCESEARRLIEGFACWIRTKRPFVTLKSGLTLDGQLALAKSSKAKKREWITSEESRAEVQRIRHASDAVMTGVGTISADDPVLTDRSGMPRRRRLLRVILDSRLRLSPKSRIVKSADGDVLVFTAAAARTRKYRQLQNAGVEMVRVATRSRRLDLQAVLRELGKRQILSVLLEAGPRLNGAALAERLVDRMTLFYAPKLVGHSWAPLAFGVDASQLGFQEKTLREFGPDFCVSAVLHNYFAS